MDSSFDVFKTVVTTLFHDGSLYHSLKGTKETLFCKVDD